MKLAIILASSLLTLTSIASAQVPVVEPPIPATVVADLLAKEKTQESSSNLPSKVIRPEKDASDREYLQTILSQLIQMNMAMSIHANTSSRPGCFYENKVYSEGAVFQSGRILLACVERHGGIRVVKGLENEPREFMWEPVVEQPKKPFGSAKPR